MKDGCTMDQLAAATAPVELKYGATSQKGRSTLVSSHFGVAGPKTVPCYRLPWNPQGTAMELMIPVSAGGLQQNTSVTYYNLRTTSVLRRRVKTGEPITVSRPIILRKIFPTGGGEATLYDDRAYRILPTV